MDSPAMNDRRNHSLLEIKTGDELGNIAGRQYHYIHLPITPITQVNSSIYSEIFKDPMMIYQDFVIKAWLSEKIFTPINTSHAKRGIASPMKFLKVEAKSKDETFIYYYREENSRLVGYIDGYPEFRAIGKNQTKLEENLERIYYQIKRGILNKESNAQALEAWKMSRHALLDAWDNPKDSIYDKL